MESNFANMEEDDNASEMERQLGQANENSVAVLLNHLEAFLKMGDNNNPPSRNEATASLSGSRKNY